MIDNVGYHPEIDFNLAADPEYSYEQGGPKSRIVAPLYSSQFLMQFTGLNDKNGENIYEGDIIEVTNKGSYNGLRVVSWDETLLCYVLIWTPHYKKFLTSGKIPGSYLKVSSGLSCYLIGNIHQHPHLLTGDRADTGEK